MYSSQMNYLPLTPPFFIFLVGVFVALIILLQLQLLHFAYVRLGISSRAALLLLLVSLVGSYVNIPIAHLPEEQVVTPQEIDFFGMRYVVPEVADWPGTVIAVNVGGALVPCLLSLYLLIKNNLWIRAGIATALVAAVCYMIATPVEGFGISIPAFVPPIITTIVVLMIADRNVAAVAYISGSLGTLIGADLLNLTNLQAMGAPVVSIGGAGTFDGIFLTGILSVIFASFVVRR